MPDNVSQLLGPDGAVVSKWHEIDAVDEYLVSYNTTFASSSWDQPHIIRSREKFLHADSLSTFLSGAGRAVEEQFGDWDRQPLTDTSPEIIIIAQRD